MKNNDGMTTVVVTIKGFNLDHPTLTLTLTYPNPNPDPDPNPVPNPDPLTPCNVIVFTL